MLLTLNGGSSSVRFGIYTVGATLRRHVDGKIDRIGLSRTSLVVNDQAGGSHPPRRLSAAEQAKPESFLLDWLEAQPFFPSLKAVGHRVVFGARHSDPERVTGRLLAELRRLIPYDREHLRREVGMIEAVARRHPKLPQIACFDTAFHRSMPQVAKRLAIPRRYAAKGVERYGFHGLSYAYLMEELGRLDPSATKERVILCHLGNGASIAAVRDGKSIDTSMGFSPTSGLVMSTRTGDLDPGVACHLARTERMTWAQFQRMVTHESGLLGVSGISSDLRDLLSREDDDVRASEAVALFCYQAKKWIGSFCAALGGLDTLVFAGGIGENAPLVRERICDGLDFVGVALERSRNAINAPVISQDSGKVKVRVIRTDEDLMIARSVISVMNSSSGPDT